MNNTMMKYTRLNELQRDHFFVLLDCLVCLAGVVSDEVVAV